MLAMGRVHLAPSIFSQGRERNEFLDKNLSHQEGLDLDGEREYTKQILDVEEDTKMSGVS